MTRTRISEETFGKYFVDEQGELWRHVMYASSPTASMERVDGEHAGEKRGGCVGSRILDGFTLLVPEGDDDEHPVSAADLEERCTMLSVSRNRCTLVGGHSGRHMDGFDRRWT